MEKICKEIESLRNKANKLADEMHNALVEFVKENGGFINTDYRHRKDKGCDPIFGFFYDDFKCLTEEDFVMAVKVEDNALYVLLTNDEGEYFEDGDRANDDDRWYSIFGGYICQLQTLYNLCDTLHQYVE